MVLVALSVLAGQSGRLPTMSGARSDNLSENRMPALCTLCSVRNSFAYKG